MKTVFTVICLMLYTGISCHSQNKKGNSSLENTTGKEKRIITIKPELPNSSTNKDYKISTGSRISEIASILEMKIKILEQTKQTYLTLITDLKNQNEDDRKNFNDELNLLRSQNRRDRDSYYEETNNTKKRYMLETAELKKSRSIQMAELTKSFTQKISNQKSDYELQIHRLNNQNSTDRSFFTKELDILRNQNGKDRNRFNAELKLLKDQYLDDLKQSIEEFSVKKATLKEQNIVDRKNFNDELSTIRKQNSQDRDRFNLQIVKLDLENNKVKTDLSNQYSSIRDEYLTTLNKLNSKIAQLENKSVVNQAKLKKIETVSPTQLIKPSTSANAEPPKNPKKVSGSGNWYDLSDLF